MLKNGIYNWSHFHFFLGRFYRKCTNITWQEAHLITENNWLQQWTTTIHSNNRACYEEVQRPPTPAGCLQISPFKAFAIFFLLSFGCSMSSLPKLSPSIHSGVPQPGISKWNSEAQVHPPTGDTATWTKPSPKRFHLCAKQHCSRSRHNVELITLYKYSRAPGQQ